ncbi:MAG TPA: hypothetical protein VGW74_15650 [Propionibacteriaceae bacterium]|nr:hypothetical protein [Propionibacteriaceae bacterium]
MNVHLVLQPDQWTGPGPAAADGRLELQVARTGPPDDGWVPVVQGWRYGPDDTDLAPATGVWVLADVMRRQQVNRSG